MRLTNSLRKAMGFANQSADDYQLEVVIDFIRKDHKTEGTSLSLLTTSVVESVIARLQEGGEVNESKVKGRTPKVKNGVKE